MLITSSAKKIRTGNDQCDQQSISSKDRSSTTVDRRWETGQWTETIFPESLTAKKMRNREEHVPEGVGSQRSILFA